MAKEIDISSMSYDEWLKYVFGHPASENSLEGNEWYWEFDYEVPDPLQLVGHVTRLCNEFTKVAQEYTLPQLNQGIWFIIGPCIDFGQYLGDKHVPVEARKSCVRAMYRVYADFVSRSEVKEMETCFWMWWDILLEGFYMIGGAEHLAGDAPEVENTILETLSLILQLGDTRTQQYALHGLGHLKHPKAREVIAQYIETGGSKWDEEGRKWLQSCLDGTVM